MIAGRQPLGTRAISNMACAAAFNDPRFPPLAAEEFGDVEIEISVLTPLEEISRHRPDRGRDPRSLSCKWLLQRTSFTPGG